VRPSLPSAPVLVGFAVVPAPDTRLRAMLETGAQSLLSTATGEAQALVPVALTAELPVVGHCHHRALARLGSTTHGVLHRAGCRVAVVPVASGRAVPAPAGTSR
jgi:nucleotide-binding universal stress UspA family protein